MNLLFPKSFIAILLVFFSATLKAESVILISSNDSLGFYKRTIDQVVVGSLAKSNTSFRLFTEDLSMIANDKNFDTTEWLRSINRKYAYSDVKRLAVVGPLARQIISENHKDLLPNADKYLVSGAKVTEIKSGHAPKVISEAERLEETINLIAAMMPNIKSIGIISGDKKDIGIINKLKQSNSYKYDLNIWSPKASYDEVLEAASELSNDEVIIFSGKLSDGEGNRKTTENFISELVSASSQPVFTTWSTALNSGVVGGGVVSPDKVGASIASLLTGTFSEEDKLVTIKVNYQTLEKLGVDQSTLPADVVYYNEPVHMLDDLVRLKSFGLWVVGGLLALVLLILFFARMQSRKALIASRNEQRLIAERSKSQTLFGVIAHELRTPVSAIAMMTEGSDNRDYQDINDTAQDLLSTIDDMSLMINPDHKRPVRFTTSNLVGFNDALLKRVAPVISSSGFTYHQECHVDEKYLTASITTDFYRVRVAVSNLIRNACLHSQGKSVYMTTRSFVDTSNNAEYIEWEIRDDGVGIKESDINRLFEAHQRGQSKAIGTGLGLFITKNLIEDIGGQVSYERSKEGGSQFTVRVPIKIENDQKIVEVEVDNNFLSQLREKQFLLVEDEAMLRMLGQKLVGSIADKVQVASNGKEALISFDPSIDVVITDYFMPEIDGVELTQTLRKDGFKGIIIGATAATIGSQTQHLWDAGCDDVLSKPLTKEKLITSLSNLLKG